KWMTQHIIPLLKMEARMTILVPSSATLKFLKHLQQKLKKSCYRSIGKRQTHGNIQRRNISCKVIQKGHQHFFIGQNHGNIFELLFLKAKHSRISSNGLLLSPTHIYHFYIFGYFRKAFVHPSEIVFIYKLLN